MRGANGRSLVALLVGVTLSVFVLLGSVLGAAMAQAATRPGERALVCPGTTVVADFVPRAAAPTLAPSCEPSAEASTTTSALPSTRTPRVPPRRPPGGGAAPPASNGADNAVQPGQLRPGNQRRAVGGPATADNRADGAQAASSANEPSRQPAAETLASNRSALGLAENDLARRLVYIGAILGLIAFGGLVLYGQWLRAD